MADTITVAEGDEMALYGLWLGYPPCCANGFRATFDGVTYKLAGVVPKLIGTGYIPCPACNAKYTPAELEAYIARHRLARTPFPTDPWTHPKLGDPTVRASILRRRNALLRNT